MLESPPAALHVQSPALPSLEQCSDAALTHPLLRFLHRSIYRQHTPDPDCLGFFFLFPRQPWRSLGREQVSSASGSCASVRHRQRQGHRDKCSHPPVTLLPKPHEVTQLSLGDHGQHELSFHRNLNLPSQQG